MTAKIDDRAAARPPYSDVCTFCARLRLDSDGIARCAAFGGGDIPDDIWYGRNNHHKPFAGDHGLTFIPRKR